ncbi:ABC transporter permease [Ruminococcus sp.]|uniref:ABC transporter permease n=1 Tax=Ruminococcus sp. TaxID=41978 RepID=UPI003F0CFFDA
MKFISLLKKELRELLSAQLLIVLAVTAGMMFMIGQLLSDVVQDAAKESGTLHICDQDDTDLTRDLIARLKEVGYEVEAVEITQEDRAAAMQQLDISSAIILPQGFTDALLYGENPAQLETVSVVKSASVASSAVDSLSGGLQTINTLLTQKLMEQSGMTPAQAAKAQHPVTPKEITVVSDKSAQINSSTLVGFLSMQNMLIPIVVFMLVMYTSQMIIGAISTEKIDKTLETLLSAPVSRLSVILAKMLAAAIVALLNALVYMLSFTGYLSSMMSQSIGDVSLGSVVGQALTMDDILTQLGVNMTPGSYLLVGLQMFLTILVALSVSIILGALVNDAKSAQSVLMPIMVLAMIPYLISMMTDVQSLSPVARTLLYAIPFTHTFSAMSNVMFGNMTLYWIGAGYQFAVFLICITIALRLFTSDRIFTMSIQLGTKQKFRRSRK